MLNIAMKLKVSSISEEFVLCLRICRQVQEQRFLEFNEKSGNTEIPLLFE